MSFARTGRRWLGVLTAAVLLGGAAGWAAGPDVKVQMTGSHQSVETPGAKWTSLEKGGKVVPGDRILYTIQVSNKGDRPASNASALGPIPAGTVFVPGTATTSAELRLEYSVDGGKTFSATPTISVVKEGKTQVIPAPAERYTAVRWTWNTAMPVGAEATLTYQVQVR